MEEWHVVIKDLIGETKFNGNALAIDANDLHEKLINYISPNLSMGWYVESIKLIKKVPAIC